MLKRVLVAIALTAGFSAQAAEAARCGIGVARAEHSLQHRVRDGILEGSAHAPLEIFANHPPLTKHPEAVAEVGARTAVIDERILAIRAERAIEKGLP
jgi:hypothetical protein